MVINSEVNRFVRRAVDGRRAVVMRKSISVSGTPIDVFGLQEALLQVDRFVTEGGFHQVATANTDFIVNALYDAELSEILTRADLVTPDGMPVVWASRLLGSRLPERVTGADFVPEIAKLAAAKGYQLFLLGGRDGVAEKAAARLKRDNPELLIAGWASPENIDACAEDQSATQQLLQHVTDSQTDILLVAFGNPKQEKWIYRNRQQLANVSVCMGVGATFDFLAGEARRAPTWMQKRGLEWLFRLSINPSRLWRRYNRDFWIFGIQILKSTISMWSISLSKSFNITVDNADGVTTVTCSGDMRTSGLQEFYNTIEAVGNCDQVIFELGGVKRVNAEFLGALIRLSVISLLRPNWKTVNLPSNFAWMVDNRKASIEPYEISTASKSSAIRANSTKAGKSSSAVHN